MTMLKLSRPNIDETEITAVTRVLKSGDLVFGEYGKLFEKKLAEFIGCDEVIAVSSGTAALHLSLKVLGVGPGDAVIVPGFTFPATANVVLLCGAKPVFADVSVNNYCMDIIDLQTVYHKYDGKEKIKAVMPVHEFGYPSDMTAIMKFAKQNNLLVIEDAACAIGSRHNNQHVGTFGDIGCFSFHPRKSLTTGEGGAIITNDSHLAEELRLLRNHGLSYQNGKIDFVQMGLNYRLTDIQASIGCVQIDKFKQNLDKRKKLQSVYRRLLENCRNVNLPEDMQGHSWQTFMITINEKINRNQIISSLKKNNIESNIGAYELLSLTSFKMYNKSRVTPISNMLYNHGLALPFCELYNENTLVKVTETLINILKDN